MPLVNLTPLDHGRGFTAVMDTCFVHETIQVSGKISYDEQTGKFFLCHNEECFDGNVAPDTLNFSYSWGLGNGRECDMRVNSVLDIELEEGYAGMVRYSTSFRAFLQQTYYKSIVSEMLLDQKHVTPAQVNFITNREALISYLPTGKEHRVNSDGQWAREGRQTGKPAKVARKLFTAQGLAQLTDKDFENFANLYKSQNDQSGTFSVVSGEDIKKWYHGDNYCPGQGTLNDSCMRYGTCQNFFSIYVENPQVCKMLILVKEGMLLGRALLWVATDGTKIMDRIYGTDAVVVRFKDWAEDNGYLFKWRQTYDSKTYFNVDGQMSSRNFVVQLTNFQFAKFPYMDTFTYLNGKGELHNNPDNASTRGNYIDLNFTNGSWSGVLPWEPVAEAA